MKPSIVENIEVEGDAARLSMKSEVSYDDEDDLVRQVHLSSTMSLSRGKAIVTKVTLWEYA